ncbi:MAG: hypothetical protein ACP5RS_07040 [Thermoplasmata archaeon]
MKISVFTEDKYGPQFIKKLFLILKNKKIINQNIILYNAHRYPVCNYKLGRMVSSALTDRDKALVLVDADGSNREDVKNSTLKHIKDEDKSKTEVIVLEYEIEEWICISSDLLWKGDKPSNILKSELKYEKYKLPDYADKLNFEKLSKSSLSFKDFLNSLK